MRGRRGLRTLATLGIAAGGPVTLVSGLFVGVTLIAGPPPILWAIFLTAGSLTAFSLLLHVYLDAVDRI